MRKYGHLCGITQQNDWSEEEEEEEEEELAQKLLEIIKCAFWGRGASSFGVHVRTSYSCSFNKIPYTRIFYTNPTGRMR